MQHIGFQRPREGSALAIACTADADAIKVAPVSRIPQAASLD